MKTLSLILYLSVTLLCACFSQDTDKLHKLSQSKTVSGLNELKEFLKIPNDALDPDNIDKNLAWLVSAFQNRGFETKILQTEGLPLFFAEREFKGVEKTALFYMHFDGQGVDPGKWDQPDPYEAVLREKKGGEFKDLPWNRIQSKIDTEWKIFARSSSDDKGPIIMFLSAIDLLDDDLNGESHINIKVILDGEEEKGSKHLPDAVVKYKDILRADYMIINDGPIHNSDRPTIVFGGRGLSAVTLTVYGPRTSQHSGHYGNYAPNPAFRMAHLLASMKDREGRVIIPGYYDGIELDETAWEVLESVPDDPDEINNTIGIAEPEQVGRIYQESLQYPSLNVRGMQSAWVGDQVRTIVPDRAIAAIDIRLVPESDPQRLKNLVRKHIENQGYYVINREPTEEERLTHSMIAKFETGGTTLPFRTDINSDIDTWLSGAVKAGTGKDPVRVRIMGGTVPIAPFINALDIPAVIVPLVNSDNNQHAPNENLRVWNFTNGIQIFLSILSQE